MSQAFSHPSNTLRQPETSSPPPTERYEQERRDQFIRFTRWAQSVSLLSVVPAILIGYTRHDNRWFFLALWVFLLFLVGAMAQRSASTGRLRVGVYIYISVVYPVLATLPLFVAGMLPVIALGSILPVILIGFYVSPRLVVRATVIAMLVFSLAAPFERWSPFSTLDIPALSHGLTLMALLFVGGLAYLLGDSLSQAVAASRHVTGELVRSQTKLTARSQELQIAVADLAARTAEFEETRKQLQEAADQSQRRADLLQASIEVSRAVVQIQELDPLLSQVTRLISHHFGVFHTGIFLIDQPSGYAVLRSANSTGGQRMLARQHKLKVGSEGIVGYVTGTGQPRIALDVGEDVLFFDNPDLPDTHSEIAVPLRTGDELIGALDVQSTAQNAFDEQDVTVLTALADQITVAIQNARLFQQSQFALQEAEKAYRRYLRQEWDRFLDGRPSQALASQRPTASAIRKSDRT